MSASKKFAAAYSNTRSIYERKAVQFDHDRDRRLYEKSWLDRFLAHIPEQGRILDVGCGTGEPISRYLIERGFELSGIDYSEAMIEIVSHRFPDQAWHHMDMRNLRFEQRFDGIVAWHSFFHLNQSDQLKTIALFSAHLNPSGALLFTAGPDAGETTGHVAGREVYHSSLSQQQYAAAFKKNGMELLDWAHEDPECYFDSIYLAKKL